MMQIENFNTTRSYCWRRLICSLGNSQAAILNPKQPGEGGGAAGTLRTREALGLFMEEIMKKSSETIGC